MPEYPSLGVTIIAISVSLTILSAVFLGLRLYCKVVRHRGFWWDDYVLIAAWVSFSRLVCPPMSLLSTDPFLSVCHIIFRFPISEPALLSHHKY